MMPRDGLDPGELVVLPTDVVNAADGWPVSPGLAGGRTRSARPLPPLSRRSVSGSDRFRDPAAPFADRPLGDAVAALTFLTTAVSYA
jgi:hypothetical protein